jgi:2-C-methyl-D-erythritol 4-phosphate cytidylyltransferase
VKRMSPRFSGLFKRENGKTLNCCSAVVAAAGSSSRMEGVDKLMLVIGGKPVLAHTLSALEKSPEICEIVVVTRQDKLEDVARLIDRYRLYKVEKVLAGGETRLDSVYRGVMQVSPKSRLIAVHDGARPFLTADIISSAVSAALKYGAAAPAVPVTSTVKRAKAGVVSQTVDRNDLFEIQTPQVFESDLLKGALQNAIDKKLYITDDCMAVEALGWPVRLTQGTRENIKLTTAVDIVFAEALLSKRGKPE